MSPISSVGTQQPQQANEVARADQTHSGKALSQKHAYTSVLYKNKTSFAHCHSQRVTTHITNARNLAQLLGMRRSGMAKTHLFTAKKRPRSPEERKEPRAGVASKILDNRRLNHDGRRGGRSPQKDPERDQEKEQQKQRQKQQKEQPRGRQVRGSAARHVVSAVGTDGSETVPLPPWLADAAEMPDGPERRWAVAEACCGELLLLREQIRKDAPKGNLIRFMRQMHEVRTALGVLLSAGSGAIRQRLVDGVSRRPAAETRVLTELAKSSPLGPTDAGSREKLRSFNLLAGLILLSAERPVTTIRSDRAQCIIDSMLARYINDSGPTSDS